MKYSFFILFLIPTISLASIKFSGLSEDSSIDKNSFLCPSHLEAEGQEICQNRDQQAIGFEFDGPKTLQLFNNQQYWVQEKYKKRQLLMARAYHDSDLESTLKEQGWSITGGFLVLITTDPLITNQVETKVVVTTGKIKVVAQLWYNGDNLIQLWAQDAALINQGEQFSVSLSNSESSISQEQKSQEVSGISSKIVPKAKNFSEIKKQFLEEIELSPKNILMNDYNVAIGSPKNIKIVVS